LFVEYKWPSDCWYCWSYNNKVIGNTDTVALRSIDCRPTTACAGAGADGCRASVCRAGARRRGSGSGILPLMLSITRPRRVSGLYRHTGPFAPAPRRCRPPGGAMPVSACSNLAGGPRGFQPSLPQQALVPPRKKSGTLSGASSMHLAIWSFFIFNMIFAAIRGRYQKAHRIPGGPPRAPSRPSYRDGLPRSRNTRCSSMTATSVQHLYTTLVHYIRPNLARDLLPGSIGLNRKK